MAGHIQINDVQPRIRYVADGSQRAFSFPFAIFKPTDLEVWLDDARQAAGFTVTGAGGSAGGSVSFTTAPAAGVNVTLRRRLAVARTTDYQADGLIRAKTLNDELDFQIAAIQQLAEELGRAVLRSPTSPSTADLTLPEPAAGRSLKWNATGTALVNTDHDPDDAGDLSAAAQTAVQARNAAVTARDQAIAAVNGVRVTSNDALPGPLKTKLSAGDYIALTESGNGGDERLIVTSTAPVQSILDRLAFLETNLAINTLRDQVDAGWSLLKMVGGWADEFEDLSGIHLSMSELYTHVASASHITSATTTVGSTPATASANTTSGSTIFDLSWSLTHGASLGAVGVYSTQAQQVTVYVAKRTSPHAYTLLHTIVFQHPGGGWYDYWLPTPITVQGSGGNFLGVFSSGPLPVSAETTVIRGELAGKMLADATGVPEEAGRVPLCRATYLTPTVMKLVGRFVMPADFIPTEARLVVLHQAIDPVVISRDLGASASRSAADWAPVPLAYACPFDATTNVLTGVVDLSALATGTDPRWMITTPTAKLQRIHGVWIQFR